jgi:membrane protease subunit HflK
MSDEPAGAAPEEGGGASAADILAATRARLGGALRAPAFGARGLALTAALLVVLWLSTGIYKVQPDEQGVVIRLGQWVDTQPPGLHFHLPWPIARVLLPKVTTVNQLRVSKADFATVAGSLPARSDLRPRSTQMLTGDENLVEADYTVFWKIRDAGKYLFSAYDPDAMLATAAESAVREVIGRNPIQSALSDRRQQIADAAQQTLQRLMDDYQSGIVILQVQLQRIDPPPAVIDAFNDVQRARADQERARNEADAYRNVILPRARGEAARILQDSEAYKAQVIDLAQGEAASFQAAYQSYLRAPDVIGHRLYLESIDEVLRHTSRVVIDSSGKGMSNIMPYLPLTDAKPAPKEAK